MFIAKKRIGFLKIVVAHPSPDAAYGYVNIKIEKAHLVVTSKKSRMCYNPYLFSKAHEVRDNEQRSHTAENQWCTYECTESVVALLPYDYADLLLLRASRSANS